MIEVYGDIWTYPADVICLTTNGATRKDGAAVMGRGVAHQARTRYPGIEYRIGELIRETGNHVQLIGVFGTPCIIFPVKHHWRERADLDLITRSVEEMVELIKGMHTFKFLLPRPGCGNGQRTWEEVKPIVSTLPDNVYVITREGE